MRALLLAALIAFSSPAYSHDWYPADCCSDKDCRELTDAEVAAQIRAEPDGKWFLVKWNKSVEHRGYAPDGRFHICESEYQFFCLFIPLPAGS